MPLKRLVRNLVIAGVIGGGGFALARLDAPMVAPVHAASHDAVLAAAQPVIPTAPASQQLAAAPAALPNFTALVQRYGPAVVNITVTQRATRSNMTLQRG